MCGLSVFHSLPPFLSRLVEGGYEKKLKYIKKESTNKYSEVKFHEIEMKVN